MVRVTFNVRPNVMDNYNVIPSILLISPKLIQIQIIRITFCTDTDKLKIRRNKGNIKIMKNLQNFGI